MAQIKQVKNSKLRSPLRGWLGGKYQLASRIIERIPEHRCYVEPFAGAAWVLFKKEKSKAEVLNDINYDVVNLYRCVQHHLDALIDCIEPTLVSRQEFQRLMRTPADTLTDIQRAARFLYIHRNSFGGKVVDNHFGTSTTRHSKYDVQTIETELLLARKRLSRCTIENLGYAEVISRYDREHTFFYIDPPYYDCENVYGKGIFSKADFEQLAKQLANIKGKFLLSLNDRPEVREIFKAFNIEDEQVRYSVSLGKGEMFGEVLISNY
ncbi:MAG: DNA adenine methylase [Gammaproteobacteria bacterium]|nr:DNA adenine methylase [Gammaproteobacteria bacterium]